MLNRFLLSLAAALLLSTLASANSTNVTAAYLHSGNYNSTNHAGTFSTIGGQTSPTALVAYTSHTSAGAIGNTGMSTALSGKVTYSGVTGSTPGRIIFPPRTYGPTCCDARIWVGSGRGTGSSGSGSSRPGLSTPEPNSLMLLSTGLMGIAGMARRKLLRG